MPNSWNLVLHIILLIPQLPDMVQKWFCTPDGAMDPTFQIRYVPSRFVFDLMEILSIKQITLFFEAPCKKILIKTNYEIWELFHFGSIEHFLLDDHTKIDYRPEFMLPVWAENEKTHAGKYISKDNMPWQFHFRLIKEVKPCLSKIPTFSSYLCTKCCEK